MWGNKARHHCDFHSSNTTRHLPWPQLPRHWYHRTPPLGPLTKAQLPKVPQSTLPRQEVEEDGSWSSLTCVWKPWPNFFLSQLHDWKWSSTTKITLKISLSVLFGNSFLIFVLSFSDLEIHFPLSLVCPPSRLWFINPSILSFNHGAGMLTKHLLSCLIL